MRTVALSLILLTTAAFAGKPSKPYNDVHVIVDATSVNSDRLAISAHGSILPLAFSFSCPVDRTSCTAPMVSEIYYLSAQNSPYRCDNYGLCKSNPTRCIPVCLDRVEK